ncbi:MAG: polysaccharide deacetylase family protein [Gammaproteobacteria bacterium]|nr:polysaccharide deacetylase family protein [Gammaproteobacteria bacterium]
MNLVKKIVVGLALYAVCLKGFAATVLAYHHVSSETPPSTSVSVENFKKHLELIEELGLQVVPITTITDAIKAGKPVEHNWIAITFDDGYSSVYDTAWPLLKEKNYPFSVYINPAMVKPSKLYMDWQQLEELSDQGVIIANHTMKHENLVQDGLTLEQITDTILEAEEIIKQRLNQNHKIFVYPFGEYNEQIEQILSKHGFVGLAQHSGAINETSNITALLRFPANGIYANPKTLKNKINSLPFDLASVLPVDTKPDSLHPQLTVKLNSKDFYQSQLACFISGSSKPQKPEWRSKLEFTISAEHEIPKGRVKYNCTAPSIKHSGRFYWMSKLWINP